MGFFNSIGEMFEEREEREEWREEREEREEFEEFLEGESWGMEGAYYDPYTHGEMFFDADLGHHGVMYNGMWHPLEFVNGSWIFVHPRRFRVPRRYRPRNLRPPQLPGLGGGYGQAPQGGYAQPPQGGYMQTPQGGYPQAPQGGMGQTQQGGFRPAAPAGQITCPRCQSAQPAGTHFCSSCGNDLQAVAQPAAGAITHCTACGAVLAAGARFCASCGRSQV